MSHSTPERHVVSGTLWSAVELGGAQLINLVVFVIVARVVSPEVFGIVALAQSIIFIADTISKQGLTQALVQRQDLQPGHLNAAFFLNLALAVVAAIASWFSLPLLVAAYSDAGQMPALKALSALFIISAFSNIQEAVLQREMKFRQSAMRSIVATLAGGAVSLVFAFYGAGVWALIGGQIATRTASALLLWRISDWRPGLRWERHHLFEIWSFGIHVLGGNLLSALSVRMDRFLIGHYFGNGPLGAYALASDSLSKISQSLMSAGRGSYPVLSRLAGNRVAFSRLLGELIQVSALVAFPTFTVLIVCAPELISVVFGEKWQDAHRVLSITSWYGFAFTIFYFNSTVFMALGRPAVMIWLNTIQIVGNLVFFFAFLPFGFEAAVIGCVLRAYATAPLSLYFLNKYAGLSWSRLGSSLARPVLGSLLLGGALVSLKMLWSGHSSLGLLAAAAPLALASVVIGALTADNSVIHQLLSSPKANHLLRLLNLRAPAPRP